jgi:flagellin
MPQIINTNIASLNAQRNLDKSQSSNQQALQRLSSGLRINSAKDDAAGLAISTRFTSQIKGLNVAVRNAGDGIALAQTAEGALGSMNDSLQRIRELAVQSANATNSDVDRDALQAEVSQLVAEISRTADETDFNGRNLLDGSFAASFQVGANAGQTIDVSIAELTTDKLGASDASGISSTGVNAALGNGDLIINGTEISASKASDDTASTKDAANSAIAKVATINRESDSTGVTAFVNENSAIGTKQTAVAGTTTLSLNGVSINLQTSADAAGSRASVVESINAFAEQTGITAIDSGSDASGVELVAADGRNIDISFGSFGGGVNAGNVSSATGLASAGTKTGGFTLVSNEAINIDGGDGSAIGDLANAGLTRGTYDKGVAAVTTEKANFSTTTGELDGGGTAFHDVRVSATATVGGGAAPVTQPITYNATVDGTTTTRQIDNTGLVAGDAIATLAKDVNDNVTGVEAWEQIDGVLAIGGSAATEGFTLGNADGTVNIGTFTLLDATTTGAADLTDQINAFDFGTGMEVTATYAGTGTDISLSIKNFTDVATEIVPDNANLTFNNAGTGATALTAAATDLTGVVKFKSDTADSTNLTISRDLDDAGGSAVGEDIFLADTDLSESGTAYTNPNGLGEGDLTINGVAIKSATSTSDTASATVTSDGSAILSSSKEASAISIAAAINDVSAETGVTATVGETVVVGNQPGASAATFAGFETGDQAGLYINGVNLGDITLTNTTGGGVSDIDTDKARTDAINLINASSGQTGVTAVDNGKSISLEAADGRNISVAIDNKSGNDEGGQGIGAVFGLSKAVAGIGESVFGEPTNNPISAESLTYETTTGKIQLSSASEFSVDVGTNGKTELDALGFQAGTFGGGEDGQFLKDIDITTVEGATNALIAVDNAIGQVASQRADLGAIQNRMESTVSNLQVTSENLNAANSRIQDADFAAETAELQRTNVLQQAGISVLAQANAAGQQVLSLLG